jgi:hypothetical protein
MQRLIRLVRRAQATREIWQRVGLRRSLVLLVGFVELFVVTAVTTAATIGPAVKIGSIAASALPEVSGIVDSRANPDTFWVHNDKGDSSRFYAISHSGTLLGTFPLSGAPSGDWEDIAIGSKPGGGNYLYLGDIGDNNNARTSVTVYRTDEPQSTAGATIPAGNYTALHLQYPGGPRDAESMFVDPLSGDLFVITKRTAIPEIYSVPATAFDVPGQTVTMTALGNLGGLLRTPTAADISPDGRFILVRSSNTIYKGYLYERQAGQSVADALHGDGVAFTLGAESQGEAIGWAADGTSFYTTSESDGLTTAPIHSYTFSAPPPLLAGDYNDDHVVDASDYTVWRDQMGAEIALPNETETLGHVTVEDYDVWRAHFGETLGGAGAAAVPESASWMLFAAGCAIVAISNRQGRALMPGSRFPAAACPGACT